MLKRLYVNNYKCLVNFELSFARTTLLVGLNGSGKSTVFDVLEYLREFVVGEALEDEADVEEIFPSDSLTRWQSFNLQRFELTVSGGPAGVSEDYHYLLELEHDRARQRRRVHSETVQTSTDLLFRFEDGEVSLFRDNGSAGPQFPFDWTRSGLTTVVERHDNTRLSWFKRWLWDLHTVRLNPFSMRSQARREVFHPRTNLSDFARWYRHLMQEHPREVSELFNSLGQVLDGFRALELIQDGEVGRTLKVRFATGHEGEPQKSFQLGFRELSDGQRALIALYTLLHTIKGQATTLCLDEPGNFVALAEIQPLIFEFCDAAEENGPQVVFASHHPEIIDHPAIESKLLFRRDKGGPTRIEPLERTALPSSEVIARGWEAGQHNLSPTTRTRARGGLSAVVAGGMV